MTCMNHAVTAITMSETDILSGRSFLPAKLPLVMHSCFCYVTLLTSLQLNGDALFRTGLRDSFATDTRPDLRRLRHKIKCTVNQWIGALRFVHENQILLPSVPASPDLISPRDMPDLHALNCTEAEMRWISDAWSRG